MAVNVRQLSNRSPAGVDRAPAGEVGQIPEGPPERARSLADFETLLEQDRPERVVATLDPAPDPSGAAHALMGIAFFRLERYGEAAAQLRLAIDRGRSDPQLQSLLDRAVANELTGVARAVPAPTYLDEVAAPAGPRPGQHAEPAPPGRGSRSVVRKILTGVGELAGKKLGLALGFLTTTFGEEPKSGSLWSSWYRQKSTFRGLVMLARRRDRLNRRQLFPAYPAGAGTGFFGDAGAPPPWTRGARSSDGSYTDRGDPMAGAAGTRFGFNTDPAQTTGERGERLLTPNPRTVSRVLMTRKDGFQPVPFLNLIAGAWIQFMNHDWVSYGEPDHRAEPYRIPLAEDDPVRKTLRQTHMLVRPTQTDPSRRPGETGTTHLNEVTSWWDASQIYGSDAATERSLRSFQGGKLALDPRTGNLPVLPDGVEQTGFRRNWWLGLSMLHLLFAREHNAICDMLATHHPDLDDQRLYDTARLINAAILAKIHTVEWTPAILANPVLYTAMNANWYGAVTNLFRPKAERRTLAEINIADPIAGGLVGNATADHGVPYSLTREFVSVYRLHPLLPDQVELHEVGAASGATRTVPLAQLRQQGSHRLTDSVPMADLFYSFGRQHPGKLVLHNYPETLQNLSIPGAGFYDLAAVDVLRDRERGVPRYNQFRRLLGLPPITRFEDLSDDAEDVAALERVYASVEDLDLLVGNLAESHRPTGFGFGETLFEVFILNASRRLQADRFFTECYREDVYTAEGLQWIDDATLKQILLRHFPGLAATGLGNVDNAFEPWDTGPLDPERHPLRQFDKTLRRADEKRRRAGEG